MGFSRDLCWFSGGVPPSSSSSKNDLKKVNLMTLMQNVRRIGLVGLVLVASSVSAFADTIISWDNGPNTTANAVTATASATAGSGNTAGTEIKTAGTGIALTNPVDGADNDLSPAYLTFDLRSTGAATVSGTSINQLFTGTFSIHNTASGGTVLVSGNITANLLANSGATSFNLSTASSGAFTGSLVTAGGFTTPFGIDLNLYKVSGFGTTSVSGTTTSTFTSARNAFGDVLGSTTAVPEPSTFALLGLGAAGLAFGAYRRRAAAV